VYFGFKEDDTPGGPAEPAPQLRPLSLILSALIMGALYALITAALDGFEASLSNVVLRGLFFGAAMTVVMTIAQRLGDRDDRSSSDDR
jgi:hypothetical protein